MSLSVPLDTTRIQHLLGLVSGMVEDTQNLLTLVGVGAQQAVLEKFHNSKEHFAPNAKRTIAEKEGDNPLRDTGVLMNSIRYQVQGNSVQVGSNVEYAEEVHDGDSTKHQPARPFLEPDALMQQTIEQVIQDQLEALK